MNNWLEHHPLQQFGEALIAGSVESLYQGWKASADALGKLRDAGADRWQAAVRQMQTPINLADILRARTTTTRKDVFLI